MARVLLRADFLAVQGHILIRLGPVCIMGAYIPTSFTYIGLVLHQFPIEKMDSLCLGGRCQSSPDEHNFPLTRNPFQETVVFVTRFLCVRVATPPWKSPSPTGQRYALRRNVHLADRERDG